MKRLIFLFIMLGVMLSAQSQVKTRQFFKIEFRDGVSIYGYYDQPSAYGVDDGECHVTAIGGSWNFAYYLNCPGGLRPMNTSGVFEGLSPGWYFIEIYDFGANALYGYPQAELHYPLPPLNYYSSQVIVTSPLDNFGNKPPGKN